jgi:bifunctional enzyme CysN/CysC
VSVAEPSPIAERGEKSLLRFCVCGSVDNGKSTLIGRLLFDRQVIPDDVLAQLKRDSVRAGVEHGAVDLSFAVDGLAAEREQGITIDVAYHYFTSANRRFIVIDTPGHEQYTRNMATGASHADAAVILTDITEGAALTIQTRRHIYVCWLLGVRKFMVAVNKMDLAGYNEAEFASAASELESFAAKLGVSDLLCVPISAKKGDNVVERGPNMTWYPGPTLFEHLEKIDLAAGEDGKPFRMPVQLVQRNADGRSLLGTISAGAIVRGDAVVVQPSGTKARVSALAVSGTEKSEASSGHSVLLKLDPPVDAGRGDLIADAQSPAEVTDHVSAQVIWLGSEPMLQSRRYVFRCGTAERKAVISTIKHKIDMEHLDRAPTKVMRLNDIAACNVHLDGKIAFEPYAKSRELGSFILIDRLTNKTVAMGMIDHSLRRSENVRWQSFDVSRAVRAEQKSQKPLVIWFTGLSGAGKSTIANALESRLVAQGRHTYLLDGDNVRKGLNSDLGFTDADRVENLRRLAETARLMADAGLIVLVCAISPFARERLAVRETMADIEFLEVFVDAPLEVCERRDPKGLYRRARAGDISNFTGIDSNYEPPENPDIRIQTIVSSVEEAVDLLSKEMQARLSGT